MSHIEAVFLRLRDAGLKLKMSKCQFLKREVNYPGHLISANGTRHDPEKVATIQKLTPPTTVKGVSSFLGLSSFYRNFVQNYTKIENR